MTEWKGVMLSSGGSITRELIHECIERQKWLGYVPPREVCGGNAKQRRVRRRKLRGEPREQHMTKIPDVLRRFKAYHEHELAWGYLHIVLDDGNIEDSSVRFCIQHALENGDGEAAELGKILLGMSKTQRKKLSRIA